MPESPTQQLVDIMLGDAGPLEHFVRSRRAEGRSWRLIERDVVDATDRRIDVTYETLRRWYPDPEPAEAAS